MLQHPNFSEFFKCHDLGVWCNSTEKTEGGWKLVVKKIISAKHLIWFDKMLSKDK